MIFWKTEQLANELVNTKLTERNKIQYYLAIIYLQLISSAIPSYFWGSKLDNLGLFSYFLGAVVATYCILRIFHINKEIDGRNMIERLAILSFPAFFKSTILYWIIYFAFSVIYAINHNMMIFQVFSFLILPFYYWVGFELIAIALQKQCSANKE
jgi:hypothetical protein